MHEVAKRRTKDRSLTYQSCPLRCITHCGGKAQQKDGSDFIPCSRRRGYKGVFKATTTLPLQQWWVWVQWLGCESPRKKSGRWMIRNSHGGTLVVNLPASHLNRRCPGDYVRSLGGTGSPVSLGIPLMVECHDTESSITAFFLVIYLSPSPSRVNFSSIITCVFHNFLLLSFLLYIFYLLFFQRHFIFSSVCYFCSPSVSVVIFLIFLAFVLVFYLPGLSVFLCVYLFYQASSLLAFSWPFLLFVLSVSGQQDGSTSLSLFPYS